MHAPITGPPAQNMNNNYRARSDNQTTAQIVGCHPSKVRLLVLAGLLEYLNGDLPGVVKYCATLDVLERTSLPKWQVAATKVLAGLNLDSDELRAFARKPRTRGLQVPTGSPTDQSLTGEAVRAKFLDGLTTAPDGSPISALLGDSEVARILGFRLHDLPPLRRLGILRADNQRLHSAKKLHSREYILGLALDVAWLGTATRAINGFWREKNGRKGNHGVLKA